MKFLARLTLFLIVFLSFSVGAFAHQIGIYGSDNDLSRISAAAKTPDNKVLKIKNADLNLINAKMTPLLLIKSYSNIDNTAYTAIVKYLKVGGKIILFLPDNTADEVIFKKLCKLIGVNLEKIKTTKEKTEINWVEKTLENNTLNVGTKIAQVTLYPETSHLAVFGDIERHESAISLNQKGSLISWLFEKGADKRFNEQSLKFLIEELLPQNQIKSELVHPLFNYSEDIARLNSIRDYIKNYQDNIINYTFDNSIAQQNLEKAKFDELSASYYYKNNDFKSYEKYLKQTQNQIYAGASKTNNLAPAENHGIWFDRGTIVDIKSRSEMGQYFDKLQKSGINTVYMETFNAGFTIYPSKVATQTPLIRGKDPLAWAIEEAHARKMKLQAWLWIFAVGNDRHNKLIGKPNYYVGPVLEKNLRWALLGENGNFRPKSQPEFWIDPSNKEAVNFIFKLTEEIIKNYDVDGIQLDYIRYPFQRNDNLMGFNHNSTEQFTVKTGEKLFCDNYQANLLWNKWKEENINSFVKKISTYSKKMRPSLKISASVFSKSQSNRLNSIQQNWENWMINSYIDSLTPMSYSTNLEGLKTNLSFLQNQTGTCPIYPGIALKHVDEVALLKQIALLREYGYSGISLFAMAQLDNNKVAFLEQGRFLNSTTDPSYAPLRSAILLMEDYKTTLITLKKTSYDLPSSQKNALDTMISNINSAIFKVNSSQLNSAIEILNTLEKQNNSFFNTYSNYNNQRKQTTVSYLKKATNLLKIAARK